MSENLPADGLLAHLRQQMFAPEFQIGSPAVGPAIEAGFEFARVVTAGAEARAAPVEGLDAGWAKTLAELATCLWRLRTKLIAPGKDEPLPGMEHAARHFDAAWHVLTDAGFRIVTHDGEPVPEDGVYSLRAIATEPMPGLPRPKVLETIKPSVYWKDTPIQVGEVVVGVPAEPTVPSTTITTPKAGA